MAEGEQIRARVLREARQCITVDRHATHGEAEDSFAAIAEGWNWWLRIRQDPGRPLTSADVATMMTIFKIARQAGNPAHLDNYIDGAGYLALAAEIALREI